MNKYIGRIFKNGAADFKRLKEYGFCERAGKYFYSAEMKCGLRLEVEVGEEIRAEVLDPFGNEPYTLFLDEEASGSFIGEVRAEYEKTLSDIAGKCFDFSAFESGQTQKVIDYVFDRYGDRLEFLWKDSENAVWRRKDNKKWYGAVLTVKRDRLGFDSDEKVEVLDLRADAELIPQMVDNIKIFGGYHMNKKHWITVCLDGTVNSEEIFAMIDKSYILANPKKPR